MEQFDLDRFVQAQSEDYEQALSEIREGQKRTHWMWYVFPQLDGLGRSSTAKRFGIKGAEEAKAYLEHSILGARLRECVDVLLRLEGRSAELIFGFPDVLKLRSCATLFGCVSETGSQFHRLLAKYYEGEPDRKTLQLLGVEKMP